LRGQAVREVAISLFQGWVSQDESVSDTSASPKQQRAPAWFGGARKYAQRVRKHDMASVRRSIEKGRVKEAEEADGRRDS
jgi:hypothetical protein